MTTIYLDACCLDRPFDDLIQARVRLESEAVLIILAHIESGQWEWVTSDALVFEISQNPDEAKRRRIMVMMENATRHIAVHEDERIRAAQLITTGFQAFDALHIACAESSQVDVLLTTDDHMVQRAERLSKQLTVRVANPLAWLREVNG
jgi:predicted nucleic acid-binding protein